jgi:hypothetical protein
VGLEERTFVYVNATTSIKGGAGEKSQMRITVNVELVQLSLNAKAIRLISKQLVFDGSNKVGASEVEANGKIGCIHFEGFAVRSIVDVLDPATERGWIARGGEEV